MIGSKIRRMASKSIEYYAGSIGYFWWITRKMVPIMGRASS